MNAHRRQSFCGFAPSLEKKRDDRYGRVKQRKYSSVSKTSKINKPVYGTEFGGLRRASSLPDCKEIARIQSRTEAESQAIFSETPAEVAGKMKRTRSVSFAPEVVLFAAVAENDVAELRKIMLKDEIDINHQSPSGLTALHYAAAEGSCECVQLLIESGAKVESRDSQGCTALDFAVRGGHFDCASYLINAGAEIKKIVNGL
ncbi:protein phosphatase 1 regulatory subunit 27-like [Acropora muricata]|uniref:protein phosphatase 1 regulatory subunit 27-like n=1 Tax=Acropora muricata TaxID=159855 RepID=UPI0034E5E66C